MNYEIAHFNWSENGNNFLLTNDIGKYCFLSSDEFHSFIEGTLSEESDLYPILYSLGFIYRAEDQYISTYKSELNNMKRCLLIGTQLLILVLTDSCNQRCVYCQAGKAHASKMSVEDCKKAIDMAIQSPVLRMTIEFQGGEPTLNPEVLYFAIPYAKQLFAAKGKRVDFAIVTNLTNINPSLLRWLIEENVHISTSLDGNRPVHEYNRPLVCRQSSYDAWHEGANLYKKLCSECGKASQISAIQTTTKMSLEYPKEIIDEYLSNGMDHLYIRPLTPLGCAHDQWHEIGYSADEFVLFYRRILNEMLDLCQKGRYVVESTASIYLTRILNNESVGHTEFRSPCGAGVGQLAVNYDGNVYTCDEGRMLANMGDPLFRLGTVNNTYRELLQSPVIHAVCTASCIEGLPFCSDCVYSPYCAVCPVVNYGIEGDLISRSENSYRCSIAKGILSALFEIIQRNNPDEMEVLQKWAND